MPSPHEIALALVSGFLPEERLQATALLVDVVLPWDLRGLSTFPTPRRLVDAAFAALAAELARVEANGRLARLEEIAWRRRGQQLLDRAVGLAVARWSFTHRETVLPDPWREAAEPYSGMDVVALGTEAAALLRTVTALEHVDDPCGRRALRAYLPHARVALHAAHSGSFSAASGSLAIFLRDVGETSRDITLEIARPRTGRIPRQLRQVPAKAKADGSGG